MANRYANLEGGKKISEDFQNINIGFDRVQAEMETKGTPADAQAKADAAKAAAIATAAEALAAHKARGADEHPTAKGNAAGFMSAADKLLVDARTSAATPDTLMQRDAAGRAKVAAPAATDDIARKAETDAVQANLNSHATDTNIHVTAADHTKLNGIAVGAEVNQNAFAKVNGVSANSKTDTLQITGGTGITITEDPANKRLTVTATGEATPGAHASSHIPGGTDVIPFATETVGGLMAPADKKDITTLKAAINRVDLTANLGPGSSVINADQASDVDLTVYGMTRVNLLGADGNFEVDSNADGIADGWTGVLNSATATNETSNARYGLKAQRITSKASDTSPFRRVERTVNLKAGKRYVFMSDVLTDGIGACKINAQYSSGTTIESVQSTASKVHFIKLAPTEDTIATVRLYNYTPIGTVAWVQFDGAGVFEVSDDLYNRIGVDITEANIRDYLPHVDGRQHVQGVTVTKESKNLLPPLLDSLHANAKVNGPYDLVLNATAATQQSSKIVNVIPNTKYILSGLLTGVGARVYIHTLDASGNPNYGTSVASLTETISTSAFATDANTTKLFIRFSNSAAGSFTFKNWQLEIGSVATQFEFADPQRLILPVTLASTPDGSVRDTAYYRDGSWRKMQRVDISVDPAVALTTPVESEIAKAEGTISLHPGGNQITVATGVIQREKVTFNATTKQGTTSKRSSKIIGVYKGANPEPYTTYTSGGQTLPQLVNAVENGKDYYVTYMALDKYALSANMIQTDAKYVKGLSGTMSDAVRDVARLGQQNSRQDFADIYIQALAENLRVDVGALTELLTTNKTNLVGALNEVFQSGVDGKNLIKSAVIVKGGTVAGTSPHSFEELADGIETIETATVINGQQQVARTYAETIAANDPVYTLMKLANETTFNTPVPADAIVYGNCWSPDGVYLILGIHVSPYLLIYKKTGNTLTLLPNPTVVPGGTVFGASWSPDGIYLAVAHSISPFFTVYKRSGDSFIKLSNPSVIPSTSSRSVSWSSDRTYLAVMSETTPYLYVYKLSNDALYKLADPAYRPSNTGYIAVWSPDTTYLAVGTNTQSPSLLVYRRDGDTLTKLATPANINPAINSLSWSPDGTYLAVGTSVSPFLLFYKRSGDTFTWLSDAPILVSSSTNAISWDAQGKYIFTANANDPYFSVIRRRGDKFRRLPTVFSIGRAGRSISIYNNLISLGGTYESIVATIYYDQVYKASNDLMVTDIGHLSEMGYALESGNAGETKEIMTIWR